MLNHLTTAIRNKLQSYLLNRKKRIHHSHWALIMASNAINNDGPDSEVLVDYMDTRMMGQRGVTPTVIRPFGLGRGKG
jgi:hypothetical protein